MKYLLIFFLFLSYPTYSQEAKIKPVEQSDDKTEEFCANHPTHWKCTSLPVRLVYFLGYQSNSNIILKWSTASEKNCNYFEVLGSNDGYNFEYIAQINSQSNTTQLQSYYQIKIKYYKYYKLSQVDLDNSYNQLKVIIVKYQETYLSKESNTYDSIGRLIK